MALLNLHSRTSHKKISRFQRSSKNAAPLKMGFDRSRRNRPLSRKPPGGRRSMWYYLRAKRRRMFRWLWKLRRYKDYYRRPQSRQCSSSRLLPLFRRYRFYSRLEHNYLPRLHQLSAPIHRFSTRRTAAAKIARRVTGSVSGRLRQFLLARTQPLLSHSRTRRHTRRKLVYGVFLRGRKSPQLLPLSRSSVAISRFQAEAPQQRARATTQYVQSWTSHLHALRGPAFRTPRVLARTLAAGDFTRLATKLSIFSSVRTSVAVNRRLWRCNTKKVTSIKMEGCGKCANCKRGASCKRPRWKLWRQGRRAYAGLFRKRRYRAGRRDRRLLRRASRRLSAQSSIVLRTLSAFVTKRCYAKFLARRRYIARKQGFSPRTAAVKSAPLLGYLEAHRFEKSRALLRASWQKRPSRLGGLLQNVGLRTSSGHVPLQHTGRAVRTPSFRVRSSKYAAALHYAYYFRGVKPRSESKDFVRWTVLQTKRRVPPSVTRKVISTQHQVPTVAKGPLSVGFTQLVTPAVATAPTAAIPFAQPRYLLAYSALAPQSFFQKKSARISRALSKQQSGRLMLWGQKKFLKEQLFYRKSPRLRLPLTAVTRRRRRKGGLGLFAQNSLKSAYTVTGLRRALFAPQGVVSTVFRRDVLLPQLRATDLRRIRQRKEVFPQHWGRLPKRRDLKPLFWVQRSANLRVRKKKLERLRARYFRKKVRVRRVNSLKVSAAKSLLLTRASSVCKPASKRLALVQQAVYSEAQQSRPKNSIQRLLTQRGNICGVQRRASLWQARSVRSMRRLELALSAWSPQYQTRRRRWAFPRQYGGLLRRSWISRRTRRERASLNAGLARRNRPQQKYWDRGFIHLQYHLGSAASIGYDRLRRVHRPHSRFSRWWKPINRPVPFPHPFSRRALNAKRYYRLAVERVRAPRTYALAGRFCRRGLPGERMSRHMPARQIPWRNFSYPAPRRGAPATIQRWTMRSLGRSKLSLLPNKPYVQSFTASRRAREMRRLEGAIPSAKVWANRRWRLLDSATLPAQDLQHLSAVYSYVPSSVWEALRVRVGSLSKYAAVQRAILVNFRSWGARAFGFAPRPLTASQASEATAYLLALIRLVMSSSSHLQVMASAVLESEQQQTRLTALAQKVLFKRDLFWKRRELPALQVPTAADQNPLRRENSVIYKHWLQGAARFLKQAQRGYTPPSRSRYSANRAKDFGRRRLRFPASGRRRRSYDSMLHAFAKRVGPSKFRRAATLKFVRALPRLSGDFRENVSVTVVNALLHRQRTLAWRLSAVSAFSREWRELDTSRSFVRSHRHHRSLNGLVPAATKRRFASLPINAVSQWIARSDLRSNRTLPYALRAIRAGILRRALRRRRRERAFADLRGAVLQRRMPRERAIRPWRLKRRVRARLAARSLPWKRLKETKRAVLWGLSHLSARGTRPGNRVLSTHKISPSGEILLIANRRLRRDRRALRGFSLLSRRRRLRRKLRDSMKRRRGRRRRRFLTPLGAMLLKTHWSEGRELKRLRRVVRRPLRAFVKKFITPLPKLLSSLYGGAQRNSKYLQDSMKAPLHSSFSVDAASAARHRQARMRATPPLLTTTKNFTRHTSSYRLRRRYAVSRLQNRRSSRQHRSSAFRSVLPFRRIALRRATAERRARTYTGRQFISPRSELHVVGALFFQKPITTPVKSEATKRRELEASIASREVRYKLTAQYVQNLTAFIPELINYMLSRRLIYKNEKITFATARYLIRNIYWSLRVYLNVDPFDGRFMIRDQSPATRVRLTKLMEDLSAAQVTEQPQRAALRFRLQPGRLLRVRNKVRFRGDWLRNFLPAQHALYLENADEYGLFLLRTDRIVRLRFGPRGIASWKTTCQESTQEVRARQLLTLRYSKATPRFETMLQGTRRTPHAECAPRRIVPVNRVGFFARPFSTQAKKAADIVGGLLQRRSRLASVEDELQTPTTFIAVTARYRVLPRIEARGKTSFVGATRPSMSHTYLDSRFVRAKSPRSRQYLLRAPNQPQAPTDFSFILQRCRQTFFERTPRAPEVRLSRRARRFVRSCPSLNFLKADDVALSNFRSTAGYRLLPERFKALQIARMPKLRLSKVRAYASRRITYPATWAFSRPWPVSTSSTVELTSPSLLVRTAKQRSTSRLYKTPITLPPFAVLTQPVMVDHRAALAGRGRRYVSPLLRSQKALDFAQGREQEAALAFVQAGFAFPKVRLHVTRAQAAIRSAAEALVSARPRLWAQQQQILKRIAPLTKKQKVVLTRTVARLHTINCKSHLKIAAGLRQLRFAAKLLPKKQRICAHRRDAYMLRLRKLKRVDALHQKEVAYAARAALSNSTIPSLLRNEKRGPRSLIYGGAAFTSAHYLSELCVTRTRLQRQAPFDTYRTRLWDKLTLRRAKRERVARYWIKETGRWMRDPWIANAVSLEMRSRPGLLAGELRAREQQIGEYVPNVDAHGRDILLGEEDAPLTSVGSRRSRFRERHAFAPRPQPKLTELARAKRAQRGALKPFVHQRLQISKSLRKKPIPMMWLANYEYNDFWREFKAEKAKTRKQRAEEAAARRQENFARAAKGLAPLRDRRYALKMPPLPKLPKIIWKEIHRRVRRLEWRESDEVFFRKGFRNAFRFYPQERNRAPWLEALMYTRATFSTRLQEFRRRSFPREQKKYKWLQRVRKALFPTRTTRYIKWRKWRQLRMYNQRLHYSLFNLPDRNAARRHFRKLNRRSRPAISSFIAASQGLGNRVDLTLMHLKIAPSIFWARVVAPFGLLRVNGVLIKDPAHRLKPADTLHLEWDRIARFQHFFEPNLRRREAYQRRTRRSTSSYPTNFEYHRGTRTLVYKHAPDEADLRKSSRLRANYFRWFKLDSV